MLLQVRQHPSCSQLAPLAGLQLQQLTGHNSQAKGPPVPANLHPPATHAARNRMLCLGPFPLQAGAEEVLTQADSTGSTPSQLAIEKGHRLLGLHLAEYHFRQVGARVKPCGWA